MACQFLLFLLFQSRQYCSLYCCIWIGWMTEMCFIMWFICIYTCMIHLFHYVLHPHIRYMQNPFHYEYPYVKVLFVMCFIQIPLYETCFIIYTRTWNMCFVMCFIQRYSYIKHLFHLCFIHRYPYMKHVFHYVLHPHIPYMKHIFHYIYIYIYINPYVKHVSLCASSTDTHIWNMFHFFFIHRYPYMKHLCVLHPQIPVYETSLCASSTDTRIWNISVCFIHRYPYMKHLCVLHPQIPVYETSLCASSTDTRIWNISVCFIHRYPYMKHLCVLRPQIPLHETCFIMCSSTYETDPALNSFACFLLALQRHQDMKWTYASFDLFTEDVNLVKIRLLVLCWTVVKDD